MPASHTPGRGRRPRRAAVLLGLMLGLLVAGAATTLAAPATPGRWQLAPRPDVPADRDANLIAVTAPPL